MSRWQTGFCAKLARRHCLGSRGGSGFGPHPSPLTSGAMLALTGAMLGGALQAATSDILWRNSSSGADTVWLMQSQACNDQDCASYGSSVSVLSCSDPNWKIVGTGDFNGDGQTDIVWRHYGTGQNLVWHMNGTTYVSSTSLPACSDLN